ncbi:MAG: hypothetical protein KA319_04310 [Ferruginibacter sp.]|nr:hypothetical protein [Ferruginibacter sp.]
MSFENFPTADKANDAVTPNNKPSNNNVRNIITGGLVAALLGTWGYIIYDKNNTKQTIETKDTLIASTSAEKDQLRKELDDATMRYDMIKTSSADMEHAKDSVISKRDREITEKKARINQLLSKVNASKEELAEAKSLIASLNTDITTYKSTIEKLEGEKIVLIQEKEVVTKERDLVRKNYDSATTVIKQKEEVIDVATTLHASNFAIIGVNEKSGGKEKTTTTAKKVDKLRISFDIDENRVAPSGEKKIYVTIIDPSGKVVSSQTLGSGTFNTRDGAAKEFTQKLDVNYVQGQRQTLSIDWKNDGKYTIGDYKIEVYHNGFKIGEGYKFLGKGGLFG